MSYKKTLELNDENHQRNQSLKVQPHSGLDLKAWLSFLLCPCILFLSSQNLEAFKNAEVAKFCCEHGGTSVLLHLSLEIVFDSS